MLPRSRDTSIRIGAGATLDLESNTSETLNALLDSLIPLLGSFATPIGETMYTSEPRLYRLTPSGRAALTVALDARCVQQLIFGAGNTDQGTSASTEIDVTEYDGSPAALTVTIGGDVVEPERVQQDLNALIAFTRHYFTICNGAAGYVAFGASHLVADQWSLPKWWEAVTRYVRGAFWGNALGPQLCEVLGGRDYVLRHAPVALAEPLGQGVWLQVSESAPATETQITQLAAFLAPILDWSRAKRQWTRREPWSSWVDALAGVRTPRSKRLHEEATFSVRLLDEMQYVQVGEGDERYVDRTGMDDITYNLYFDRQPTDGERTLIRTLLEAWDVEERTRINEYGWFHFRSDPAFNGTACRWYVDTSCRGVQVRSVQALREWMAVLLPDLRAVELVLGTEVVG